MSMPPVSASSDLLIAFAQAVRASHPFIELDARGHVAAVHQAFLEMGQHAEQEIGRAHV